MSTGLHAIVALLRENDASGALAALDALGEPGWAALAPAEAARAHAYRAQALRGVGRVEEAAREVIHAIRFAKAEGDAESVVALRALHTEISASVASVRLAEAGRLADAALISAPDDTLDAEGLLRKAGALANAGALPDAERATRLAVSRALTPREIVLTHLALARLTRDEGLIHAAHRVADAADDHNLITAVAHAARALGVRFAPPSFG